MRIFAIDPGLTIGYAWYEVETGNFGYGQTNSPDHVISWAEAEGWHWEDIFVVENYNSAGHLTKEAFQTIKLVGFFEFHLKQIGADVTLVPPQKRLNSVARATTLIGDARKDLHRDGRDAIAALAHAISYARTLD